MITAAEQEQLQIATAAAASLPDAERQLSPTLFIVCSRGFMPMPVPTLSLSNTGPILNPVYASHPIWWLRSDIRNGRSDEDFRTDEGRMRYLARMMATFNALDMYDPIRNTCRPVLTAFDLFPDRITEDAEQITLWLNDQQDQMDSQSLRDDLNSFRVGLGIDNPTRFVESSAKAARSIIESLNT